MTRPWTLVCPSISQTPSASPLAVWVHRGEGRIEAWRLNPSSTKFWSSTGELLWKILALHLVLFSSEQLELLVFSFSSFADSPDNRKNPDWSSLSTKYIKRQQPKNSHRNVGAQCRDTVFAIIISESCSTNGAQSQTNTALALVGHFSPYFTSWYDCAGLKQEEAAGLST